MTEVWMRAESRQEVFFFSVVGLRLLVIPIPTTRVFQRSKLALRNWDLDNQCQSNFNGLLM
ncbi:hypothetical protein BJX76DRAFT_316442, partial [Aspergillus varians]